MCDVRLFRSARMDLETAKTLWKTTWDDEMMLNNAAYHLQQAARPRQSIIRRKPYAENRNSPGSHISGSHISGNNPYRN
nr:hypothetical protein [uncultured Acetatifactor sp.]